MTTNEITRTREKTEMGTKHYATFCRDGKTYQCVAYPDGQVVVAVDGRRATEEDWQNVADLLGDDWISASQFIAG